MSALSITLIILALLAALPIGQIVFAVGAAIGTASRSAEGAGIGLVVAVLGQGISAVAGLALAGGVIFGTVKVIQHVLALN